MGFRIEKDTRQPVSKDSSDENNLEINRKIVTRRTQSQTNLNQNQINELNELKTKKINSNWSNGLPYEILLKIFSHFMNLSKGNLNELKRVRYVCKYWSIVSNDSQLWKNIYLSSIMTSNTIKDDEKKFNKKFENFVEFSLRDNKFLYVEKLTIFNLHNITCDQIHSILTNCNSKILLDLSLVSCKKINNSSKNLQVEKVIGESCPNLRSLDLSQNEVSQSFNLIIITLTICNYKFQIEHSHDFILIKNFSFSINRDYLIKLHLRFYSKNLVHH